MFSTKRGLRKQHHIKNKADIKTFNNQSDEGRDVRKHKFSSLVKTKKTKSVTKLIDETQEYRKQNREERNPLKLAPQQTKTVNKSKI